MGAMLFGGGVGPVSYLGGQLDTDGDLVEYGVWYNHTWDDAAEYRKMNNAECDWILAHNNTHEHKWMPSKLAWYEVEPVESEAHRLWRSLS